MKPKLASLAVAITAPGASAVAQSASPADCNGTGNFTFPTIDFPGPTIPVGRRQRNGRRLWNAAIFLHLILVRHTIY